MDRLGDGFSSFVYSNWQLISSDVEVAIEGSEAYGEKVAPARFEPVLEGYGSSGEERFVRAFVEGSSGNGNGSEVFNDLAMEIKLVSDGVAGDESIVYGIDL